MRVRERSVETDAIQWSGSNWHAVLEFAGRDRVHTEGAELHFKTEAETDILIEPGGWLYRSGNQLGCATDEWFKRFYEPVDGEWPE